MQRCPQCRSGKVELYMGGQFGKYRCRSCSYVGPLVLESDNSESEENHKKVIIVGAGFGGLETALRLRKLNKKADIAVIDRSPYHVYLPNVTEYFAEEVSIEDVTLNLKKFLSSKGIKFIQSSAEKIDGKYVYLKDRTADNRKNRIGFDYLVISIGSDVNTFGLDVDRHAFRYHSLYHAQKLRDHVKKLSKEKKSMKVAIVGAGLVGCELASHMRYYADEKLGHKNFEITLVDAADRLMKELPKKISEKAYCTLKAQGIGMLFSETVVKLSKNTLLLKSGKSVKADTIVWSAGITAPKEISKFGVSCTNGGITVNNFFQSVSSPNIFAVGDCIMFRDQPTIKRAQTALHEAAVLSKNIDNMLKNRPLIPYTQKTIPTVISLKHAPIFHYKNIIVQNRLVNLIHSLIFAHYKITH